MSSPSIDKNESNALVGEADGDELVVREARAEDAPAICALFKRIFSEEMSQEHWVWKYERELSRAIVIYKEDRLVAHYGGVGTEILQEGNQSTAIQITDLMVDPSARHAVRSKSPFYISASKFLNSFVGYNKPFLFAYGFPSERAMKLSERLGLYAPVGRMWEMTWQVNQQPGQREPDFVKLDRDNFSRFEKKINNLWEEFSRMFRHNFITKKNADYFRWRFLEHPAKKYTIYYLPRKFFRQQEGLLVIRHDKHKSILMDFLAGSLQLSPIVNHAKKLTALQGGEQIMTWCTDVYKGYFRFFSVAEKPLPIILPANTESPGPAPENQRNKWWLLPGDTDYL